jgi:hypothetical protein
MTTDQLLLIGALICFLIETIRGWVNLPSQPHLGWLGLALWVLSLLT